MRPREGILPIGPYLRRHKATALLLFGAPLLIPILIATHLQAIVESRFEGRRYSVPSRIYSDRLLLEPGLRHPPDTLEAKLRRLGYREVEGGVVAAGEFARFDSNRTRIEIWMRDFPDPLRYVQGFPVTLSWTGDTIREIRHRGGQTLEKVAIEPEIIGTVFDQWMEDRTVVPLPDISPRLTQAIIEVEDQQFLQHGGIDPRGLLRAVVANLTGGRPQGGSTLTMQLVKNLFLTSERTVRRKGVEIFLSLILDALYEKDQILEAYLNEIYLGQRGSVSITGVQEACRHYFGTDSRRVDWAEAALLAGIIRAPGLYDPWKHPEAARNRRSTILDLLVDRGLLSPEEADTARERPLTATTSPPRPLRPAFFVDHVLTQVRRRHGPARLGGEGLKIFTTLDPDVQLEAEAAISKGLADLEEDHPRLATDDGRTPLQAALVALTPANGYIRAMVGGRDHGRSQFNRATQARRQPGSLFKPFVYLAALEKADPIRPTDRLKDSPITVVWDKGRVRWTPRNYDMRFRGLVSIREALEKSLNVPAVRVAMDVGLAEVVDVARRCGISSDLKGYPSLPLGAFEITPIEIASAYTTFANGGVRTSEPTAVLAVVDGQGQLLERFERPLIRAAGADAVYVLDTMLQGVMNTGTARSSRDLGVVGPMAGKTGTTNNYHDAWFAGFSPRILAAVWVGFDDERHVGLTGSQAALPIWADWIKALPPSWTEIDFPPPPGVVNVLIDPADGGRATWRCPNRKSESFLLGTEPQRECRIHGELFQPWSERRRRGPAS